ALETAEWRALRAAEPGLTGGIDERIALTLPAIFDGKTLISVPPLGWTAPGTDGTGGVTVTCCLADRLGAPCSDNRHPAPRSTA
ncbi:MAG TPA: hypothetical protein PK264_23505, partial [Hyphomicrobiaceae bacterium]|nr:hypothetical protein [Hyphomicrobiaceae bacterium]